MGERDWSSLERGVLRDVFIRLPSDIDAINFRRVCPGWRVATAAGTTILRPWFILSSADDDGPGDVFVRPVDRRRRHTRIRSARVDSVPVTGVPPPACVRGTSRGWLAVNEGERLFLRDPISCAEIRLPACDAGYQLFDIFLSDDPLVAPGNWMAFAFFEWDDVYTCAHNPGPEEVLAFCRPGDAEWARVDLVNHGQIQVGQQTRLYRGLEFFGGRPYVLLKTSRLAVCDVEARRLVVSSVHIHLPPGWKWDWQECLVECGGDLLVVQVARRDDYTSPWYWPGFCLGSDYFVTHRNDYYARAFKIVFDADGSGMPVASVAVTSTGDYAVFVAPQGHAFALPASGFPAVRAGCVYFAVNHTRNVQGMVIIDLHKNPWRHDRFVRKLPLAGNWRVLSWFCPRPVLDTTPPARRHNRRAMHAVRNAFPFFN